MTTKTLDGLSLDAIRLNGLVQALVIANEAAQCADDASARAAVEALTFEIEAKVRDLTDALNDLADAQRRVQREAE
ncbi:hypothetical protein [Rhodobacter sp. CZR27]|uniref:hypothetical protein n=1 Tax=Rhodobacter sp. CZR27 TaxID=2033869 RepID=UPI000BBE50A6|nr:hypothetical protein [Rhodobacter sp. CZR27]